jgi:thiol-disulfide isomerase/thioredoxin
MFSASIENPNGESLFIEKTSERKVLATLSLKNGIISKEPVNFPMGYYRLFDGKEFTMCFLKPDFDLLMTVNAKRFDETIKYSGKGADENNYLAKKSLLGESYVKFNSWGYNNSLDENAFLTSADSIYTSYLNLFNEHKHSFDKDFLKLESECLKIDYLTKIAFYESHHLLENNNFTFSEKFPDPFKNIVLDDEQLLLVPNYINFIILYLRRLWIDVRKKDSSLEFGVKLIDLLDSEIRNGMIKENIAYSFWQMSYENVNNKELFYNKMIKLILNSEYLERIEKDHSALKQTEKGTVSPAFELYDINEELVRLEDFRGKIVLIDIWATWCSPCVKEIPHLEKLQNEYKDKNIVFISICVSDDREKWKVAVREKNLLGIHLCVPDLKHKFLTDYNVTGIPRFILIDENGFIIESHAPRPSFPELKQLLIKLL